MRQRVFFFEEPVGDDGPSRVESHISPEGVIVATPHLPHDIMADPQQKTAVEREMLDDLLDRYGVRDFVAWYYTPMALAYSDHLQPLATIYDCMDELSHFKGAPPEITLRERELISRADLVFTGGQSLYEAKRDKHRSVHCFPSSVDAAHFRQARAERKDPADQAGIPHPRIGYAGVIDERMNYELIDRVAEARPDWQIVMLGPVVKVDPASLPNRPNIHWLGMKRYEELPAYLSGWDVAMLPFAHNDSTKFISPTKTPEYLAAGRPVVSTSIRDVVRPYGTNGLAFIADDADEFVAAIEQALALDLDGHHERSDAFLQQNSWDRTAAQMMDTIDRALLGRASTLVSSGLGARM